MEQQTWSFDYVKEKKKLNPLEKNFGLFWSGKEFKTEFYQLCKNKVYGIWMYFLLISGGLFWVICTVAFSEVWRQETEAEGYELVLRIGK